jgi:hypothetical protein
MGGRFQTAWSILRHRCNSLDGLEQLDLAAELGRGFVVLVALLEGLAVRSCRSGTSDGLNRVHWPSSNAL